MTAGEDAAVRVSTTSAVRCTFPTCRLRTDWHLPAGEPRGLIWSLTATTGSRQHGFVESRKVWTQFATRAVGAGFLVVAPTLPVADLFGVVLADPVTSVIDRTMAMLGGIVTPEFYPGGSRYETHVRNGVITTLG